MRRSFSFRSRTKCKKTLEEFDALCICLGNSPIEFSLVNDEIQNALKVREPLPDAVYILSFGDQGNELATLFNSNRPKTDTLLARGKKGDLSYLKDFSVLNFKDGDFARSFSHSIRQYEVDLQALLRSGAARLVQDTGAYQRAPTGHVFKHPSGRKSRDFLLATELLRNEVDAYFLALCVCEAAFSELRNASTLYIDTMGIYAVARAICDVLVACSDQNQRPLSIASFHSHDGLAGFQPNSPTTDVVLVSASTSGKLPLTLCLEKNLKESNVITLLDLTSHNRKGHVIYGHLDHNPGKMQDTHGSQEAQRAIETDSEEAIELVGEYFAARGKRPKALTLTKDHLPTNLEPLLKAFSGSHNCGLQVVRTYGTKTIDTITFNQEAIVNSSEFREWLSKELSLRTPVSVSHIIAAPGAPSEQLAHLCVELLKELKPKDLQVVPSDRIEELLKEKDAVTGVLVCNALAGNGHALRNIARDLRELVPLASRHFIVGCGLPDTYASWNRLKQFLTQSGDVNRPYLFACWKHIAIGEKRSGNSWSSYAKLLQYLEHVHPPEVVNPIWPSQELTDSLTIAMGQLEAASKGFLTTTLEKHLELTEGFVYWQAKKAQLESANHEASSYLAIASVVQNAREFENNAKRLKSTLYETVVLDPENFLRFNDGILHACLLRSSHSFELDYSMSPDMSSAMREILEKLLVNHAKPYGESAPEFAAALASGHLRLTNDDLQRLVNYVAPKVLASKNSLLGLLYVACERFLGN